jgi:hypothetical protein
MNILIPGAVFSPDRSVVVERDERLGFGLSLKNFEIVKFGCN